MVKAESSTIPFIFHVMVSHSIAVSVLFVRKESIVAPIFHPLSQRPHL